MEHAALPQNRAVVLLSGGLDSTTVAAIAKRDGFQVVALSFNYGQRHTHELEAARRVARTLEISDHRIVSLDLRTVGGSALTDNIAVPKEELSGEDEIPITYVPARNTIFLSVALGLAEVVGAFDIYFGANALDYSGYPDCRPEFVASFERLANVATKVAVTGEGPFQIHAPLMKMTKAEIIKTGLALGIDYAETHSCYDPVDALACGQCESCRLRKKGFEEAGVPDPTRYR